MLDSSDHPEVEIEFDMVNYMAQGIVSFNSELSVALIDAGSWTASLLVRVRRTSRV